MDFGIPSSVPVRGYPRSDRARDRCVVLAYRLGDLKDTRPSQRAGGQQAAQ